MVYIVRSINQKPVVHENSCAEGMEQFSYSTADATVANGPHLLESKEIPHNLFPLSLSNRPVSLNHPPQQIEYQCHRQFRDRGYWRSGCITNLDAEFLGSNEIHVVETNTTP